MVLWVCVCPGGGGGGGSAQAHETAIPVKQGYPPPPKHMHSSLHVPPPTHTHPHTPEMLAATITARLLILSSTFSSAGVYAASSLHASLHAACTVVLGRGALPPPELEVDAPAAASTAAVRLEGRPAAASKAVSGAAGVEDSGLASPAAASATSAAAAATGAACCSAGLAPSLAPAALLVAASPSAAGAGAAARSGLPAVA